MLVAKTIQLAIIGPGLVGSEFISQIASYQARPSGGQTSQPCVVSVVAIASSRRMILAAPGASIDLATWKAQLEASKSTADLAAVADAALASGQPSIIVDCTSSELVAEHYPEWLLRGLHIVTPNKKGFSGPLDLFKKIKSLTASRPDGLRAPSAYHEATVGAGLPIISTLKDLVETGDEIVRIEGIFSGTLSYIFNQFSSASSEGPAPKFSDIVAAAKEKGYTEPDPRDDLNGMDVARKVVILARCAGLDLGLDTLPVENIVPESLRGISSSDDFMARLPEFDEHFRQLNESAKSRGQVLRCVGVVNSAGGSCVKLLEYSTAHPFASLKGSDNIISFTTKRFPNSLIVQGAGAGASVTAFGIFSDVLKIMRSV